MAKSTKAKKPAGAMSRKDITDALGKYEGNWDALQKLLAKKKVPKENKDNTVRDGRVIYYLPEYAAKIIKTVGKTTGKKTTQKSAAKPSKAKPAKAESKSAAPNSNKIDQIKKDLALYESLKAELAKVAKRLGI
jgi:hypothetical protein